MTSPDRLWATVYLDAQIDRDELFRVLTQATKGRLQRPTLVLGDSLKIHVGRNDDFDEVRRLDPHDGFFHFRYTLDVDPQGETSNEDFKGAVGALLEGLWREGYWTATACQFGEELPRGGTWRGEEGAKSDK